MCYHRRRRNRHRKQYEVVLDDYAFLTRMTVTSRRELAARFGMTAGALDAHLLKARRNGDPRARKVIPL